LPRFSIPGFRWLRFAFKASASPSRGFCWGDSESSLRIPKEWRTAMRRMPAAKPQRQQIALPPSRHYVLANILRRHRSHQHKSNSAQGGVVALVSPFHDETPRAKVIHTEGPDLGFEQGVSSPLTLNEFKLECCFCFRWRRILGERGDLRKARGLSLRQAHVMEAGKTPRFAA
jgi:hypothetical protein